jgi:polyisoprenoid-binding protein YceI
MRPSILPALLASALALPAFAVEFRIDDAWGRDSVQFRTTAPLEDVVGSTNQIKGKVTLDPKDPGAKGTEGRIEVDTRTFKTGLGLRDQHLAKTLKAAQNPGAVFQLNGIKSGPKSLDPDKPADFVLTGTLQIAGVTKNVEVPAQIAYLPKKEVTAKFRPGNHLRIKCDFDVTLADYGIDRAGPILKMQVGETAHVSLSILATDATDEELAGYREGAKKYLGNDARTN